MVIHSQRSARLAQRLLQGVFAVAGGASLLLGLGFLGLYRNQLEQERAEASLHLNRMLQVTWENAMLKRDVDGLRDIVGKLGQLPGIRDVLILAPDGEVRFASDPEKLGRRMPEVASETTIGKPVSRFEADNLSGEVLRSINPVQNRDACVSCHGAVAGHPVNGILVVDYDAAPIRRSAWQSAALFLTAGTLVLVLTLFTLWWLIRRHVLAPLADLDAATLAMAGGNYAVRAVVTCDDEIGRTATGFNVMAEELTHQIDLASTQRRYLQSLLDGVPDGVRVIRQSDYTVVTVNDAYVRQIGSGEHVGIPCYRSSHDREQACPATMVLCPLVELCEPGETLKCHHHHKRSDGGDFGVEIHARLIEVDGKQGRERYVVELVHDMSQVARLSQEQRLSELGLLAAGIAHEIHNPLGSLRLGVEGLLRQLRGGNADSGRITNYLEMMDGEIDRCSRVTQRLLLLSRPPQPQRQPVDINAVLVDTLALLDFDACSRGITQTAELDSGQPRALADDADLRMLTLNLVQNAHHAMPSGGRLTVRSHCSGDGVIIEIVDSGVGIAPEDLPRIFEPFFSRRADQQTGTGLGLTICQSIVNHYSGYIEVSSSPGTGTVFHIHLPRANS